MRLADIPAGLGLCRASGWNQTDADWRQFLTASPEGTLVAVEDGRVVGSVATLSYGPFAWVSMVLVDPASRGRGIGTLLLERGLECVPGGVVARLDATPAGEGLYRRIGFVPEYGLARLVFDGAQIAFPSDRVAARPLAPDDWSAVLEMDRTSFGASRAFVLERFAAEAPACAWVVERRGELRGWLVGRRGTRRDQLGPLVAADVPTALALLDACLQANAGRPFYLDVPDGQNEWRMALARIGFGVERPFLRMRRGTGAVADDRRSTFAIAGPEFG